MYKLIVIIRLPCQSFSCCEPSLWAVAKGIAGFLRIQEADRLSGMGDLVRYRLWFRLFGRKPDPLHVEMTLHPFTRRWRPWHLTLNSTQALTGLTRAFKCAVDASTPDFQLTRDVSDLFALLKETNRILSLHPSSGLPTLYSLCAFALAMPLPLPFEHHLALGAGHELIINVSTAASPRAAARAPNIACAVFIRQGFHGPHQTLAAGCAHQASADRPPLQRRQKFRTVR